MQTVDEVSVPPRPIRTATDAKALTRPMRAMVQRQYGTPDVLEFEEIANAEHRS